MAFYHVVFPIEASSLNASPIYNTTVITGRSGAEMRNSEWQDPLHSYEIGFSFKTMDEINTLRSFFHLAKGREGGFLIKDAQDYSVDDWTEVSETLTGSLQTFQLFKHYEVNVAGSPVTAFDRTIKRVQGFSVELRDNTVEKIYTASDPPGAGEFYVNDLTGELKYTPSSSGAVVEFKIGLFWVPVRFEIDRLPINLLNQWVNASSEDQGIVEIPSIPLIEVREDI